jgi:hypothetical protein
MVLGKFGLIHGGAKHIPIKKMDLPSSTAELRQISILPEELELYPGEKKVLTARGLDGNGQEVSLGRVAWNATGGVIDENGVFSAGLDEGSFKATATVGEIPHQRWTQFYNRVLTKFAVRKGLKLSVTVEISDASKEEIEEMKVTLRELGLNDEVEVR